MVTQPCSTCNGSTVLTQTRTLKAHIPAGVDSDGVINLRGQGSIGSNGGRPGDVLIAVEVTPHELFRRDGLDIHCELPVNFAQAALGTDVEVPVLGGTASVHVPANTQTGKTLRLKEKGIHEESGRHHGDHFVHVKVVTPRKLNRDQRRLFEELARTMSVE